MSEEKLPRAAQMLASRFCLHCESPACAEHALASRREPLRCEPRSTCERCGGSSNRRAETEFLEACAAAHVRHLVVVGGSPAVREELAAALSSKLELRMVDGTERRTADRAKSDLDWADLVLVWGASELHHDVSIKYTQVSPQLRKKVVHVVRRGVAALLAEGAVHLNRR